MRWIEGTNSLKENTNMPTAFLFTDGYQRPQQRSLDAQGRSKTLGKQKPSTYIGYADGRTRKTGCTKDLSAKFTDTDGHHRQIKGCRQRLERRDGFMLMAITESHRTVLTALSSIYPLFPINGFIPYVFFGCMILYFLVI
jgi:hypothetical protein